MKRSYNGTHQENLVKIFKKKKS